MNITPQIVAIGDSLIYGRHDAISGGWIGRLRSWLEKKNEWSAIFNLGIGGNDTRAVLGRIKRELTVRPFNAIIIGIGTNDARQKTIGGESQVPLKEFKKNFNKIIKIANSYCSKIIVPSVPPVDEKLTRPLKSFYYINDTIQEYWNVEKEICLKYNALFLDFWEIIDKSNDKVYSDGVHYNEVGHELFFQYSCSHIEKLFQED